MEKRKDSDVTKFINSAREFRIKQEALWMELDYMMDGNHYVYYDKTANQIRILPQRMKGEIRRSVNLMRAKVRGVSNMVTKNEPAFNIRPEYVPNMDPQDREKAQKESQVAQFVCAYLYKQLNLKYKFKQMVRIGLNRGLAIGQIFWDEDKSEMDFAVYDPYDVLIDPLCGGYVQNARWIIKSVVTSKASIEGNKRYKMEKCDVTTQMSVSTYRDSFLQSKYSTSVLDERVILHEIWERQDDGIRVRAYIGNDQKPIRDEVLKIKSYPFYVYYPERKEGEMYPRPLFADLIQLNKTLDALYSFVEEFIGVCGQGRYIMPKGTKITTLSTGKHGQIMQYEGSTPPTALNTPSIPMGVIQAHMSNTERYMAEIGGIQYMDVDSVMKAGTSGRAIAQLQAQQLESVGEPTDNLAETAADIFEGLLELAMYNWDTPRTVTNEKDDDMEVYKVRGGKALGDDAKEDEFNDEVWLKKAYRPRVELVPASVFSDIQQRSDAMELFQAQLLDKESVLEAYAMGNIREIIEKMEKEQVEKAEAQLANDARKQRVTQMQDQEANLAQKNQDMNLNIADLIGQQRGMDPEIDAMMQQQEQPAVQ